MNKKKLQWNRDVERCIEELGGRTYNLDWDTISHMFNVSKGIKGEARQCAIAIVKAQREENK